MRIVNGFHVPDYDRDMEGNIAEVPEFAGRGTYQFYLWRMVFPLIKNFRHAVDIGGHIGTSSYLFSRMFDKVTAFEPMKEHAECFRLNCPSVTLNEVALGASEGSAEMATRGTVSLKARIRTTEPVNSTVPLRTLDSYNLEQIDLLKIDCEGYELRVIEGAHKTIMLNRPVIVIEQKKPNVDRYGFGLDAVRLLTDWGASIEFAKRGDYCLTW